VPFLQATAAAVVVNHSVKHSVKLVVKLTGAGEGVGGVGAGWQTSLHCAPSVHLALPSEADLQEASVNCEQAPVAAFVQQAPSLTSALQNAQELSARQTLPWPLQLV
jgi:hypothetical protein